MQSWTCAASWMGSSEVGSLHGALVRPLAKDSTTQWLELSLQDLESGIQHWFYEPQFAHV